MSKLRRNQGDNLSHLLDKNRAVGLCKDDYKDGIYNILNAVMYNTDFDPDIVDHLISSCILTVDDGEDIMQANTRIEKNRILYDILYERPYFTLISLKEASRDTKNQTIQKILEGSDVIEQAIMNLPTDIPTVDIEDCYVRLHKCYKFIVNDLHGTDAIDRLVEFELLSMECLEELKACKTPQEQNRKLLRKLIFKYKDGYWKFLSVLREDYVHKDLAKKIEKTKVTEKDKHLLQIGMDAREKRHITEKVKVSIQKVMTDVISKVSKRELNKIMTGFDLIKIVEDKKIAADDEYFDHVKQFIQTSSYTGIQRLISFEDTGTDSKTDVDEMSKEEHFDITCMKVVDNFKTTVQYREMVGKIKKNRMVLVRGPNGSGKSQSSFAYANEFSSTFPSATIWRIPCRCVQSMNMSLSILMSRLKIDSGQIYIKEDSYSCFQTMMKTVIVRMAGMNSTNHLIILDDIYSQEIPIHAIIDSTLKTVTDVKNIYVICTSNKRFATNHYRKYGMEMNKMTEDEAFSFFRFAEFSREDVSALARKLDFLPLALSVAASYIENTHTSIEKYIQVLENDKLSENYLGAHLLFQPFNLILQQLQNDLSVKAQLMLTYAPYFVNDTIPVMLLKSLLPDFLSEGEKEAEINNLIIALSKYSVAVVNGYGERRNISIHSMTCLAIRKNKTKEQIKQEIFDLLKHYCFHMDLDLRLVESMKRNVCFLSHATLLMDKFQSYFDRSSFQIKVYESYLSCAIGVTFRMYGNTELTSYYYLERAKSIIFEMINFYPKMPSYPFISSDPLLHLQGCSILQCDTQTVFKQLIHKCEQNMSKDFVQTFLANKFRSTSEIELFKKYANGQFDLTEIKHFKLTSCNTNRNKYLKKVFAPFKSTRETFLVELLISIMHESSKNKWWMESTNSLDNEYGNNNTRMDSVTDSQFSYNLAVLLQRFFKKNYSNFTPIAALREQHYGIIGFLRSEKNISKQSLDKIQKWLKTMQENSSSTLFYTYGVLKMAPSCTLYQKCMINRALLKCCIINWQKTKHRECLERAVSQAQTLNDIVLEMKDNWLICMSIYLEIAETYLLAPTKKNIIQAKQKYKMAFELQSKFGGILLTTEYHFKLYQQYIKFCLDFGNYNDLTVARTISVEMRERCNQQKRKQSIGNNLIMIEDRKRSQAMKRVTIKLFGMLLLVLYVCAVVWYFMTNFVSPII